jgi:hypothetical protein
MYLCFSCLSTLSLSGPNSKSGELIKSSFLSWHYTQLNSEQDTHLSPLALGLVSLDKNSKSFISQNDDENEGADESDSDVFNQNYIPKELLGGSSGTMNGILHGVPYLSITDRGKPSLSHLPKVAKNFAYPQQRAYRPRASSD